MNIKPEIVDLPPQKVVGMHLEMSLLENRTRDLWSGFMPRRKEVQHIKSEDKFSIQVYPQGAWRGDFEAQFTKWAGLEVENWDTIPDGMDRLELPGGKYVKFTYRGPGGAHFGGVIAWLYGEWLPDHNLEADDRPDFEILGDAYRGPGSADSEEDVFMAVREIEVD